ncbi:MAG: hypothetical protein KIT31_37500 [Deltaproteobacteria bacterium]|nr:hypothetical protein [Deltaproteobacteria bacterium]
MPGGDRNWTITPTLLWFAGILGVGLCVLDGSVQAVADRFTTPRGTDDEPAATPSSGPMFAKKPTVVADKGVAPAYEKPAPPPDAPKGDRTHMGALEDICLDGTPTACKRWGMDGFYKSVVANKAGKLGRPVRISWFGDSVIATDHIPGRLRTKMQAELGNGGPGFIFMLPPHKFCGHEAIVRSWNGGWNTYGISTFQIPDGLYGVGGSSVDTYGGNVSIKLVAGTASRAELYYLAQPKGGRATVKADGAEIVRAETAGDAKAAAWAVGTVPAGAKKFDINAEGAVRLFGIDLENAAGAVVDNLGIVSVNVGSFTNTNVTHWAEELGHRNADLVMIMIGANEAQWLNPGDGDTKTYQARYEKVLAPMKKGRPDGACLVVSPTDQAYAGDGHYPSRPVMPYLVEAQRKAALATGCAFFSTYNWMGGKGSAAKWFAGGLVGTDFQHLTPSGANKLADAVYETLMAGYRRYAGT